MAGEEPEVPLKDSDYLDVDDPVIAAEHPRHPDFPLLRHQPKQITAGLSNPVGIKREAEPAKEKPHKRNNIEEIVAPHYSLNQRDTSPKNPTANAGPLKPK